MTEQAKPSLAEQRRLICTQLRLQREVVALQLAPHTGDHGRFPRSLSMRLLIHRPELAVGLLKLVAGPRVAGEVSASLEFVKRMAGRRQYGPEPLPPR